MSRKLTVAICAVVLLLALVSIWQRLTPASLQADGAEMLRINHAFGEVLAEETAQAANHQGRVVVVTMANPAQLKDDRWNAFERTLKKHPALSLTTAVANFEPEPGRTFMPGQPFLDILERHPDVAAFVFLVDLPEWPAVSHAFPTPPQFKLIATDNRHRPTHRRYGGYFNSAGLVAVFAPSSRLVSNSPPQTQREWFDKFYQVYTPQDLAAQPDQ